jgi:hypothetical protein
MAGMNHGRERKSAMSGPGMGSARPSAVSRSREDDPAHKTYMRLSALEMERYRREQDRRVALKRAELCRKRCEEIENEIQNLLESIRLRTGIGARFMPDIGTTRGTIIEPVGEAVSGPPRRAVSELRAAAQGEEAAARPRIAPRVAEGDEGFVHSY